MTKTTHRVVKLKDIKSNFFVRRGINQDHVLMLAELYEAAMLESKNDSIVASKAVTAIQLTDDLDLIDGRHRKEAMELANVTEAYVEIKSGMTSSEMVVAAAKANYGGALPPTREDMIYTIEQLLGKFNMTQKAVEESMVMLPKSVVRKYINMANKRLAEAILKLSLTDLANGLTAAQAAKKHGVKVETIQLALEGKKPKSKMGVAQVNATLTTYSKTFSHQVTRVMNKVMEDFRDGEIPEDIAQQAINHYEHLLRRMFIRATDWGNRLKSASLGETKGDYHDFDNVVDPPSKR